MDLESARAFGEQGGALHAARQRADDVERRRVGRGGQLCQRLPQSGRARELTGETLPAIGRAFGGRNHTTVLYAHRKTAERMAGDPEAFEAVRRLTESLRGRTA